MAKKYTAAAAKIDRQHRYGPDEALELVKQNAAAGFDETVDLAVRLNVNPRHADQIVRGSVVLPHGSGRNVRVVVFARGEAARAAEEAGADVVGDKDLAERVEGGWLDFDAAVAMPDLMSLVGPLGRILGPRGLMPNPKAGTVTDEPAKAVRELKQGRIEFRTDRAGNVHVPLGKVSFPVAALRENLDEVMRQLVAARPAAVRGRYLVTVAVSATMGPAVHIDPQAFLD